MVKKIIYSIFGVFLLGISLFYALGGFENFRFGIPFLDGILSIFTLVFGINILFISILIFLEEDNPSKTIGWLLVLMVLPAIGFILYILFGRNILKNKKAIKKEKHNLNYSASLAHAQDGTIFFSDLRLSRFIKLLIANADSPLSNHNEILLLKSGEEKFRYLFDDLRNAKHHIHLEYYIIRDDSLGKELLEILIQKAKEGVKVRVIYDDVGSLELGDEYIRKAQESGIEIYPFFKVILPILSRDLNYRNHRKIVVIDGKIGYLGGINIGDEYLGRSEKFGFWRDTHLRIYGDATKSLQSIFFDDWNFTLKKKQNHQIELGDSDEYFPPIESKGTSLVQIVHSGPDHQFKSMHKAFYKMINDAQTRVWIVSPYLVPDEPLVTALKTAALSGVDVRIIIPKKGDHFFVYWSSQSFIEGLLEAGVKVYAYHKGFIHSKIVICDCMVATVGTSNLDIRSMEINFEVNAFIYDEKVIKELENEFLLDIENSDIYNLESYKNRPFYRKILEAMGKIVSPLQ